MLMGSATSLAHEANGVAVVDHDEGAISVGEVANATQGSDEAIHGKNAIRYNYSETLRLRFNESRLQIGHIVIVVSIANRFTQTNTINNRSMIQTIRNNTIVFT